MAERIGRGSGGAQTTPPVDVKALHAKSGELTLENDFLEGALCGSHSMLPDRLAA